MSIKLKVLKNFSATVDGHKLFSEEYRKTIGVNLSHPWPITLSVTGGKLNTMSISIGCMGPSDLRAYADLLNQVAGAIEECDC